MWFAWLSGRFGRGGYGVYVVEGAEGKKEKPHPVFKMEKFHGLLSSKGILVGGRRGTWKATPTGSPVLEDDYFGDMCKVHSDLEALRQCRKSINNLSRFGTVLGQDVVMGLPEFPLRVHADITYYPNHYANDDGKEIWDIVGGYFGWDGHPKRQGNP